MADRLHYLGDITYFHEKAVPIAALRKFMAQMTVLIKTVCIDNSSNIGYCVQNLASVL